MNKLKDVISDTYYFSYSFLLCSLLLSLEKVRIWMERDLTSEIVVNRLLSN